jgi:radical SAM protein with 4Fe4S-binding SPASM domain
MRYIVTVALATYFFWISLYLYVPVLPLHAQELGANLQMVGIVIASYAIGQLLLRIPIGVGSDIIGRKPFAVGALVLSALGAVWLAVSPDPWSLFAARTLTGVAAAGWVAISVLFASYYPASNTSRAMAIIMSVNTLSLVTATFIGGLIAEYFGNIDNLGNVHPDQFWWNQTIGNVKERKFSEIWEDDSIELLSNLRDRKSLLPEDCKSCKWLGMCNGNLRVRAESATGEIFGKDPACYLTEEERSPELVGATV